jgi:hypothetical protein
MSEFTPNEAKGLPNEHTNPIADEENPPVEPTTGVSRGRGDARRTEVRDEDVSVERDPVEEEAHPAAPKATS